MSNLFKELKRRKVIRVAGVYAVVAWVIIQIGEATFEALRLPPWVLTFIIVLLFTGFPITIIIAWIFDKTPEGKIKIDEQDKDLHPFAKKKRTWFAIGGIAAGIIVGIFFASLYSSDPIVRSDNSKSIAVLPFTTFSEEDEDNSFFADGMHDDILTQLSKIEDLNVISRTSVMQYKNTTKTMGEIAIELNVRHVLEGSVRRAGEQVRIVAQLINAVNDKHIWSETYDRDYADIFSIQSDVALKIANALKATLTADEKNYIDEIPTSDMEAYDYFLKGKHFWNTKIDQEGNQKAADMFDKAAELDPNFAIAFSWSSIVHSTLYNNLRWDHTKKRKDIAKNALENAIALDPDHPQVHHAQAHYLAKCLNDNVSALKEYEIAFMGEPNNSEIALYLGAAYSRLGNLEEAEKYLLKSYDLNPLEFNLNAYLGNFYKLQRKFIKAEKYYNMGIQLDPELISNYRGLALNYIYGYGKIEKARSLLKEAELLIFNPEDLAFSQYVTEFFSRDFSNALGYAKKHKYFYSGSLSVGFAYKFMGEEKLAKVEFDSMRVFYEEKILEEPENTGFRSSLGVVYAALGLKEKATIEGKNGNGESLLIIYLLIEEHELAIKLAEHLLSIPSDVTKWYLKLSPLFDPLRDNPRFQKLVAGK